MQWYGALAVLHEADDIIQERRSSKGCCAPVSIKQAHNTLSSRTTFDENVLYIMMTSSNGNIFRVTGPLR